MTYKIIRHYIGKINSMGFHSNSRKRTIDSGLTLEEVQAHCRDPETSSSKCTSAESISRTRKHGNWFDGYENEEGAS